MIFIFLANVRCGGTGEIKLRLQERRYRRLPLTACSCCWKCPNPVRADIEGLVEGMASRKQQRIRAETRRNASTQPEPETRHRLGRTRAHKPSRRLGEESAENPVTRMKLNLSAISSTNVERMEGCKPFHAAPCSDLRGREAAND